MDQLLDLSACPALRASRRFSENAAAGIERALDTVFAGGDHGVWSVVAAGSLGRLEASPASDVDAIVIVESAPRAGTTQLSGPLGKIISDFGLRAPKADGIYAKPIAAHKLLDLDARGSLTESAAAFGSRMQLLLDGRALYGAARFREIRGEVLNWYDAANDEEPSWTHLFNDLTRYLHAYAVWQQFKFSRSQDDGWYLRQAKFRSTRLLTFAGLLLLLAESIARNHPRRWLLERLELTPLERVGFVFDSYADSNFQDVLNNYEAIHARLSQTKVREELIVSSPATPDELPRVHTGSYRELHELSANLMDQLTRFVLMRRDDWPPVVFRNWLL